MCWGLVAIGVGLGAEADSFLTFPPTPWDDAGGATDNGGDRCLAFTSRRMLGNAFAGVCGWNGAMPLAADGTHNLMYNGSVFITVATQTVCIPTAVLLVLPLSVRVSLEVPPAGVLRQGRCSATPERAPACVRHRELGVKGEHRANSSRRGESLRHCLPREHGDGHAAELHQERGKLLRRSVTCLPQRLRRRFPKCVAALTLTLALTLSLSPPTFSVLCVAYADAAMVTCYAHLARKALHGFRGRLPHGWCDIAKVHVQLLYLCRTVEMFDLLVELLEHEYTRGDAQRTRKDHAALSDFWTYLKKEYLTQPFNTWFATACGMPGATPNNNPMEAWNKVLDPNPNPNPNPHPHPNPNPNPNPNPDPNPGGENNELGTDACELGRHARHSGGQLLGAPGRQFHVRSCDLDCDGPHR